MRLAMTGAFLLASLAGSPARAEPSAQDILEASGVRAGLVVHLGCGDGKLTAALAAGDALVVQGLDADPKNVDQTRAHAQSLGLGDRVTAEVLDDGRLPYADNLVNLVVASGKWQVAGAEIARVLAPNGVLMIRRSLATRHPPLATLPCDLEGWSKAIKARPAEIDEWTHYLHGPDNNAVAQDSVVGPPRHFQWISRPRFSRSHDHLASVSAVVSSGGRLFSIVDYGSIAFAGASPRWRLVARDAFNGIRLWERDIASWEYHLRDFRSGPADLARRLVAVDDRVYVTLGYGEPVVALDAATGETVFTCPGTEGTREVVCHDGLLLLVLGEPNEDWPAKRAQEIVSQKDYVPPFERYTPPPHRMRLMAVRADTGEVAWKNSGPDTRQTMPSTLAASGDRVYFQNADEVVCLDAATGEPMWKAPRAVERQRVGWSTPTLVVHDGVVFSADRKAVDREGDLMWIPTGGYHEYIRSEDAKGELIAFDADSGERLWSCPAWEGFNAPVDVMIADGLVWTGRYAWGNDPGITEARDPKTGEVRRRRPSDREFLGRIGHARCHRAKATSQYLILGRRGLEFVDLRSGDMVANFWVRGICQYGVMPANGLIYVPPHSCACSTKDLLKCGYSALAPARPGEQRPQPSPTAAPEPGPAAAFAPTARQAADDEWPAYRGNGSRTGANGASVPHDLEVAWRTDLAARLTGPVVAEGRLVVAETDAHCVHALNAATGEEVWEFAAGARIDSPPTIDRGRVLFGSADGRVYCLRLEDGALVWRFRAAPRDRQIVADGQLESAWPVSGSVLVADGAAYFTAGRNSYLDGGMWLFKLDAATGDRLAMVDLSVVDPAVRDGGKTSVGYLPDVLSTDGTSLFLRSARFGLDLARQKDDVAHLWSSVGFLDDNWWHRTYWQIGTWVGSGWGRWSKAGKEVPAGRLLVTDGSRVFGFGRDQYDIPGAHVGVDASGVWGPIGKDQGRWTHYRLFARTLTAGPDRRSKRSPGKQSPAEPDWTAKLPVLARALVLADDTLLVAGPAVEVDRPIHEPSGADPLAEALEASRGGRLLAVAADDGKTLADHELASPPVFDGVAAARGRLYLATKNGQVVCMRGGL